MKHIKETEVATVKVGSNIGAPAIGSRVDARMHTFICWLILSRNQMSEALKSLVECPDYRGINTHEMRNAKRIVENL